jgi:hypothetical protein
MLMLPLLLLLLLLLLHPARQRVQKQRGRQPQRGVGAVLCHTGAVVVVVIIIVADQGRLLSPWQIDARDCATSWQTVVSAFALYAVGRLMCYVVAAAITITVAPAVAVRP